MKKLTTKELKKVQLISYIVAIIILAIHALIYMFTNNDIKILSYLFWILLLVDLVATIIERYISKKEQ